MEGTRPKSIFDIPKREVDSEAIAPPKPKRKRSKTPKKKRPKVAKAGGVEVSQKKNVKGQSQITLKHKGGLTQEITIYTGDQKPRGVKAKGQTATWNMKPAKFKASRGLRDNRVYLQPPKREYFGNRYKSALDKIKIDQKVAEAGASKNKEIADVRDTARREREQLQQRERAKDDTISELRREKAGIVASHNVSQRNQSKATILGGDVGELNKLINRRGYDAIRRLVIKGEITDDSTILQLDLTGDQIDRLIALRSREQSDFVEGRRYVYTTSRGIIEEGVFLDETDKFVRLRRQNDGSIVKVPKATIKTGEEVAQARVRSREPSVRTGAATPRAEDFGEPRPAGSSAEERPAHRRDKPRPKGKRGAKRPERTEFVAEAQLDLSESSESDSPQTKLKKTASVIRDTLTGALPSSIKKASPKPQLEEALAVAEATSPPATETTLDQILQPAAEESDISSGQAGESETEPLLRPEPELEETFQTAPDLTLEFESDVDPAAAERRAEFLETGSGGGGTIRETELPELNASQLQDEVYNIGEESEKYSERELFTMIRSLEKRDPKNRNLPFLKSSFSSFAKDKSLAAKFTEERSPLPAELGGESPAIQQVALGRQRSEERRRGIAEREKARAQSQERTLKDLEESRTLGATTRPAVKPVITAASLLRPYEDPEAKAIREGREFIQKELGGGLAPRGTARTPRAAAQPEPEPAGSGSEPETEFLLKREIKQKTNKIKVVDNRPESERGSGRTKQKPVKSYNVEQIRRKIRDQYGTTKSAQRLLDKLQKSIEGDGSFYTNDTQLLRQFGF